MHAGLFCLDRFSHPSSLFHASFLTTHAPPHFHISPFLSLSLSLFLSQSFVLSLALPFYIFPSTSSRLPKPDDAKRNGWTSDDQRSIRLIAICKICRSGAMWIWQSDKFNSWHPFASTQVLARRNIIFSCFFFLLLFLFFVVFFFSLVRFVRICRLAIPSIYSTRGNIHGLLYKMNSILANDFYAYAEKVKEGEVSAATCTRHTVLAESLRCIATLVQY